MPSHVDQTQSHYGILTAPIYTCIPYSSPHLISDIITIYINKNIAYIIRSSIILNLQIMSSDPLRLNAIQTRADTVNDVQKEIRQMFLFIYLKIWLYYFVTSADHNDECEDEEVVNDCRNDAGDIENVAFCRTSARDYHLRLWSNADRYNSYLGSIVYRIHHYRNK